MFARKLTVKAIQISSAISPQYCTEVGTLHHPVLHYFVFYSKRQETELCLLILQEVSVTKNSKITIRLDKTLAELKANRKQIPRFEENTTMVMHWIPKFTKGYLNECYLHDLHAYRRNSRYVHGKKSRPDFYRQSSDQGQLPN